MKRLAFVLAAIASPPGAAQSSPYFEEMYRITETGASLTGSLDQTVSIAALNAPPANSRRWIVERRRSEIIRCDDAGRCNPEHKVTHDWIDGDRCPQLAIALDDLARIPLPHFAGSGRISSPHSDHAATLTIIGRPQPTTAPDEPHIGDRTIAHIMVRTQFGLFPRWWDRTEAALQTCWGATAPRLGNKPAKIEIHLQPIAR